MGVAHGFAEQLDAIRRGGKRVFRAVLRARRTGVRGPGARPTRAARRGRPKLQQHQRKIGAQLEVPRRSKVAATKTRRRFASRRVERRGSRSAGGRGRGRAQRRAERGVEKDHLRGPRRRNRQQVDRDLVSNPEVQRGCEARGGDESGAPRRRAREARDRSARRARTALRLGRSPPLGSFGTSPSACGARVCRLRRGARCGDRRGLDPGNGGSRVYDAAQHREHGSFLLLDARGRRGHSQRIAALEGAGRRERLVPDRDGGLVTTGRGEKSAVDV